MNQLDLAGLLVGFEADQLDEAYLRNRVAIAGAGHDQGRNDRESQRNLDPQARALAALALDVDGAADFFDVGLDDVHADAAPGDVGDLLRGRESGQEHQLERLALAHVRRLFRR